MENQTQVFNNFLPYWKKILTAQKGQQILNKIKRRETYAPDINIVKENRGDIIDTKLCADGTILTFLKEEKYPVKAYPDIETVWFVAYYKRIVPLIAKSLADMNWFKRIITVLAIKLNYKIFIEWFDKMSKMGRFLLKDEYFSKPIRELRRILKTRMDDHLIDAITMAIEYDSAYKFVFQDIVPLLDKENFKENPYKELQRLFDIFISRNDGGIDKFTNMYKFFLLYLKLNRKLLKQIKEIVEELKIEEIEPSPEDRYWMLYLRAYKCFGLEPKEAEKEYLKLKNS